MGDQRYRRPSAAGVGAESGLETGLQRTEGDVAATTDVARPALHTGRVDVAGRAAQHRLDDGTGARRQGAPRDVLAAVVEPADHLMARDERETDHVLEVARCPA